MKFSHKIAVIIVYFGKFPNYFPLFLESCANNSEFDWLFFTDQNIRLKTSWHNVHIYNYNLSEIEKRATSLFPFSIHISTPYKLCDYRPLYGQIFRLELNGFDFWGYCDVDMIFGHLTDFITDDMLNKYDKLFKNGHFCLYRNTDKINISWKKYTEEKLLYKVFSDSVNTYAYDEFGIKGHGMANLFPNERCYYLESFDDISIRKNSFWSSREYKKGIKNRSRATMGFLYTQGKLFRYVYDGIDVYVDESMYVHIQKRKIKTNLCLKDELIDCNYHGGGIILSLIKLFHMTIALI